jgi:hypothetical protein
MLEWFNDDFNWMLKNNTGYCPWAEIHRTIFDDFLHCKAVYYPSLTPPYTPFELTQRVVRFPLQSNPLLDIFFKALIRAEIRLISRYIPQRSNEERLTGHFVSEMDNSINMIKDIFSNRSKMLYGEERVIDFFYIDLSRGGKIEKKSGADLGFILLVDLPDYPFLVKSVIFQVKKINNNSASIDHEQFEILSSHGKAWPAYLFYDMNLNTWTSPIVNAAKTIEIDKNSDKGSHSIKREDILKKGQPFSLFILDMIRGDNFGKNHKDFDEAYKTVFETMKTIPSDNNNSNIGVVSIGRPIRFSNIRNDNGTDNDESENLIKLSIKTESS